MQPSPSAETSRLLFPSLRFCIRRSFRISPVANLFHPIHRLAIELFLNGDVRHGGRRPGAVPRLLPGRNPDAITRPNLLDGPPPPPPPARAARDPQYPAE